MHPTHVARSLAPLAAWLLCSAIVYAQPQPTSTATATAAVTTTAAATTQADAHGTSVEELTALLTKASNETLDLEARKSAANEIMQASADSLPAVKRKLDEVKRFSSVQLGSAMKALREENEGRMNETSFDLVDAAMRGKHGDAGSKNLLQSLLLIRALAHMKTTASTRELVAITEPHNGLFRAEVTRHVKALGEVFVPALIEARRSSTEVRRWALRELDGLGKRTAGDAAQVKSSQVLCDVLRAFGNIHDIEALAVILSFVNSDRAQVRQAAREALASYGGDGLWKLREAYQNLTGKPTPESWNADQVARELFGAYDHVRLSEVYELLDKGLEASKQDKFAEACDAFDRVLARQPLLDRRREMIGPYVAFAQRTEATSADNALALYRKAARLDPEPEQRKQIEAAIAFLEAEQLSQKGVQDADLYRRAVLLDPSHARAREAVERLEFDADAKKERFRRKIAGIFVILTALLGALVLGSRRFRARA